MEQPANQQPYPVATAPIPGTKKSNKLPILLMTLPIVTLIITFLLFALINLLFPESSPATTNGSLFADSSPSPVHAIFNTLLFIIGAVCLIFGPISFIVGLILLIVRHSK